MRHAGSCGSTGEKGLWRRPSSQLYGPLALRSLTEAAACPLLLREASPPSCPEEKSRALLCPRQVVLAGNGVAGLQVLKDKPDLSRWSLKYEVFGRDVEFSWLARNLQPIHNQKIHWRSLEGLLNRGAVRFYPKGPSSCRIELTVSYEVPQVLTPVASALKPFLESLLLRGLERFVTVAKSYQSRVS